MSTSHVPTASDRRGGPELSVRMCNGKYGPIAANGRLVPAVGSDGVTVRLCPASDGELLLLLGAEAGADAAYVHTPSGHWDFLGREAVKAEALDDVGLEHARFPSSFAGSAITCRA